MKIFAIVRNYGVPDNECCFGPGAPAWYEIPDSSLLRSGQPFFVPDFAHEFRVFPTLVYRISRLGKGIKARFASRYVDAMTVGACAVAVDMLYELRRKGEPWSRAVAFDKCCMLGNFSNCTDFPNEWHVRCGENELCYNHNDIQRGFPEILERLSRDITMKEGDIVMTALHPAGLPLSIGNKLVAYSSCMDNSSNKVLDINIR